MDSIFRWSKDITSPKKNIGSIRMFLYVFTGYTWVPVGISYKFPLISAAPHVWPPAPFVKFDAPGG